MNKKIINLLIIVCLFSEFLLMSYTFYSAYFTESKQTIISVDKYGEANFEAVIWFPLIMCLGLFLIYQEFKDIIKKEVYKI